MARFVALTFRACPLLQVLMILMLMTCWATLLPAQQPMVPASTPVAPAKSPATTAATAPGLPPDTFGQYGKIVAPSDQAAHPLKLKMPFPGVGEVKIPTQDEINMREKLEQLAKLSASEIRAQLEAWPAYGKMSLRDQGAMLQRIQDFRDYRSNTAKAKAHDMGLLTLLPDQQARFEKEYWDKRLAMERNFAKQFEPTLKASRQKMEDDLYREFSSPSRGPVAANARPASPANQTAQPAVINAAATTGAGEAQPMQPIAQAPR